MIVVTAFCMRSFDVLLGCSHAYLEANARNRTREELPLRPQASQCITLFLGCRGLQPEQSSSCDELYRCGS
jgi:hypothetical protein